MQKLSAHFDGKFIVLDEPARLELNAKVLVLVPNVEDEGLTASCTRMSGPVFKQIWDNPLDADYDCL